MKSKAIQDGPRIESGATKKTNFGAVFLTNIASFVILNVIQDPS